MSSPIKQAMHPSTSSFMNTLSPEVLECIFEYVYETAPSTISSLRRVSKVCNDIASRFRHRCQFFELKSNNETALTEQKGSLRRIRNLASDNSNNTEILKSIRCIEILSDKGRQTDLKYVRDVGKTKWKPLAKVIGKITNLKEMTFSADHPMPVVLIEALARYHPRARLHVKDWTRVSLDTDHNDPAELALARSPNLRTINARFWMGSLMDLSLPAFKRIVALSPNLESVALKEGDTGCGTYGYTFGEMSEQGRRAKLFAVENPSPNYIKCLKSSGKNYVDCLQGVTDISKLESLEIADLMDPNYFSKDGVPNSRFPSLRHLKINSIWSVNEDIEKQLLDALESFLTSCNPLTTLELTIVEPLDLTNILVAQGPSLQSLKIHSQESANSENPRKMLSRESLQEINKLCPLLKDITVDINRSEDGSAEKEIITILSTFPKLQTVRLYIDLGITNEDGGDYLYSHEDPSSAPSFTSNPFHISDDNFIPNIWSLISSQKIHHRTPSLKALHVKVGEWEREMGGGYPPDWVQWEASHRSYFSATPTDRDDRPGEIFVETHSGYRKGKKTRESVPEVIRPSKSEKTGDEYDNDW